MQASLSCSRTTKAYKQYQIERKNAAAQARAAGRPAPTVTGGDLDSLGRRQASLSPDEIQPGDPEIKIPRHRVHARWSSAFRSARPKLAVWDAEQAAWMVRFLIDAGRPRMESTRCGSRSRTPTAASR